MAFAAPAVERSAQRAASANHTDSVRGGASTPQGLSPQPAWRRGALLLALAVLATGAVALEVPLCPTAALFGVPCPGCGLTRATLALFSGDVPRALALHPLVPVMAPLYFALLGGAAISYARGPRPGATPRWLHGRTLSLGAWIAVAALIGVWLSRFFGAFGGPVPVHSLVHWVTG